MHYIYTTAGGRVKFYRFLRRLLFLEPFFRPGFRFGLPSTR